VDIEMQKLHHTVTYRIEPQLVTNVPIGPFEV